MRRISSLLVSSVSITALVAACSGGSGDNGGGGTDDGGPGSDATADNDGGGGGATDGGGGTTDSGGGKTDAGSGGKTDAGGDSGPKACSPNCAIGAACKTGADCTSTICSAAGICATGATDGIKDFGESAIDCGGSTTDMAPKCAAGLTCVNAADCLSAICSSAGLCVTNGASDGLQDFGESAIDCGGNTTDMAPLCALGMTCVLDDDCAGWNVAPYTACSVGHVCVAANADGKIDHGESDIDCGGNSTDNAALCALGQKCALANDCAGFNVAPYDACSATKVCAAANADGIKDFGESDIDCGSNSTDNAPLCGLGKKCASSADCAGTGAPAYDFCNPMSVCVAPTSADGIKDGTETGIDCGGGAPTNAPACAAGVTCLAGSDCKSGGCNYKGVCADAISCTGQHGGDTCGPAGNESCCATITQPVASPLPQTTTHGGPVVATATIDKYNITAGRMRAFFTATNGDLRTWISNHTPAWWNPAWTPYLPNTLDDGAYDGPHCTSGGVACGLYQELGPYVHLPGATGANEGCYIKGIGARSYRIPDAVNAAFGDEQDYTQAFDDERSMNCVPSYMTAAFCAWDGGHMPTLEQIDYLWAGSRPWGTPAGAAPAAGNPMGYHYAYGTDPMGAWGLGDYVNYTSGTIGTSLVPAAPFNATDAANLKLANYNYNYWGGAAQVANDYTIFIAPPGRFPNGNGKFGHADLAGNVFNITNMTATNACWSRSGSWQGHTIPFNSPNNCGVNVPINYKYWAMSGRCAR